jgi:hypothetical protein
MSQYTALLRQEPQRDRAALERTRDLMDAHTGDCPVTGYEILTDTFTLPDPNDRHALAAAIRQGRDNVSRGSNGGPSDGK